MAPHHEVAAELRQARLPKTHGLGVLDGGLLEIVQVDCVVDMAEGVCLVLAHAQVQHVDRAAIMWYLDRITHGVSARRHALGLFQHCTYPSSKGIIFCETPAWR